MSDISNMALPAKDQLGASREGCRTKWGKLNGDFYFEYGAGTSIE
jgi:hypothetical protein